MHDFQPTTKRRIITITVVHVVLYRFTRIKISTGWRFVTWHRRMPASILVPYRTPLGVPRPPQSLTSMVSHSHPSSGILSMQKLNYKNKKHLPWISKLEKIILMKLWKNYIDEFMNAMKPLFCMLYWMCFILSITVKPKPVLKKGFVAPEVAIPLTDQILTPDQKSVVLECKFSSKCHKILPLRILIKWDLPLNIILECERVDSFVLERLKQYCLAKL